MEILLAVVLTIMVIGLGISVFLNIVTLGSLQQGHDKLQKISSKHDVLIQNQHQIAQLLSSMTFSINGLAVTMEDLMALSEGFGFPTDLGPGPDGPWTNPHKNQRPDFDMTFSDGYEHPSNDPSLSDDEIKFLRNLLRKDEESEEND